MGQDGKPSPTINSLIQSTKIPANAKRIIKSSHVSIPLALERVSAGFPSPAQDYVEHCLDLNDLLIGNELATFMVDANSLSMLGAGVDIGDRLIVDRSLEAIHNDIVIALVDNDFTLKRLIIDGTQVYLKAENPDYKDIHFRDGEQLIIWGVVTNIIKATRRKK
nr:translesion error-prone DNA polymerase V autoproteolytic subunit [Acinetobacter ursingii]